MNRIRRVGTAFIAFSLSASAAIAGAPPARIDSEQSAAAAFVTVNDAAGRSQGIIAVITADSTDYTRAVFNQLDAAGITAAALRNMPGGATLSCVNGGSFNVSMPRSLPRALQIEWTNCQVMRWASGWSAAGPGEIVLFSDNFKPEQVAAIRLGNANRDLVITTSFTDGQGVYSTVRTRNAKMTGWIPVFSPAFDVDQHISYAYDVTGFVRDVNDYDYSQQPDYHYETLSTAENTAIAGVTTTLNEGYYYDDSQRFLWGNLSDTSVDPYWGTQTIRMTVENFSVRRIYDYNAWTSSFSIDGTVDYLWNDSAKAGCTDGRFTARTVSPLYVPNMDDMNTVQSGEVRVNGAATARYFSVATVPPNLPPPSNGTLVSMDVRSLGTFNYDGLMGLHTAANCQ